VAVPTLAMWQARPSLDRPISIPGLAHRGPVVARSTLTVDLDPHVSDSLCFGQSELDTCHCMGFSVLFPFLEIHLIFRNS
jgi:hypothetical protein